MYQNEVVAIPFPESEAWIVSCLDPERSKGIEDLKIDMNTSLHYQNFF